MIDLDYYGRSFASEVEKYRIVVLDSNGNVMLHIGRMGNVDDGMPLKKQGGPPNARSIGGDEMAIMNSLHVAVHTDKRLFISDIGNYCIRSVKLGYHAEERVNFGEAARQRGSAASTKQARWRAEGNGPAEFAPKED